MGLESEEPPPHETTRMSLGEKVGATLLMIVVFCVHVHLVVQCHGDRIEECGATGNMANCLGD